MGEISCTLVFPVRDNQVLMSFGTTGVSQGKWNGYGGKIEDGDPSIRWRAIRELNEEVGLMAEEHDLLQGAYLVFSWPSPVAGIGVADINVVMVFVFQIHRWRGVPQSTDVMVNPTWFPIDQLPLDAMYPGERLWLPRALAGEPIAGQVSYGPDGQVANNHIRCLPSLGDW